MNSNVSKQILSLRKKFIIIFLLFSVLAYFILNFIEQKSINDNLKQTTQTYTKVYSTIYNQYKELSYVVFTGLSHLGDVKNKFKKIQNTDINTQNKVRDELYNIIIKRYNVLRAKHHIKSINFILDNSTMFLKMKKPNHFGHKISNKRDTIHHVNKTKNSVNSFEIGKGGAGFRFVYPIVKNKEYLGLISITFGPEAITSAIMKQYYVRSNFFIKAERFDKKFLNKNQKSYKHSHHKGYLFDTLTIKELKKFSNKGIESLKPNKETMNKIYDIAHENSPKSLYHKNSNSIFVTIPIKHKITNQQDGFLVIRSPAPILNKLSKNYFIILILTIFLAGTVLSIIYQLIVKKITSRVMLEEKMEKDKQLFEQAKMAQMGEMIGNIAHQWRQPLSAISTAASGVKMKYEFDMLKIEEIPTFMDSIVKNTLYLSNTIDTFRDFIKETNEQKEIIVQDKISKTLDIISSTLGANHVKIIDKIDYNNPIKITMMQGALAQVIMNLINNAKDIMVEKEIKDRWIKLEQKVTDNNITISIEDNGGGVPEDILTNIFDPYFTTKHKSQGTGLGLYMSQEIVQKHLLGRLYIENTQNGAKFFIEIPLNNGEND